MVKPRKLGLGVPLSDGGLVLLLRERGEGLTAAELHEVRELAVGFGNGTVDRLARATRDRFVVMAKRCGLLREGSRAKTVRELKAEQAAERVPTPGEKKAIEVLAGARKALERRPPVRRST